MQWHRPKRVVAKGRCVIVCTTHMRTSLRATPLPRFTVVPRYAQDTKDTDLAYLSSHGSVLLGLAVPMVYGCGGGPITS